MNGLPVRVTSRSKWPVVIAVDTGRSMREWSQPVLKAVMKCLPRLLEAGCEVSICGIGDYRCHLLQVSEFHNDHDRAAQSIHDVHVCGLDKSFEIAMYYYARHCRVAPGRKGAFLMFGNGVHRDAISCRHVRDHLGDDLRTHLYTERILRDLRARFHVCMNYIVRNVYDMESAEWEAVLGKPNVVEIRDVRGLVDVILCQVGRIRKCASAGAARS
ncbi:MAG: hypothetical protein AB1714_11975 [Acidobacteriota bacterium]